MKSLLIFVCVAIAFCGCLPRDKKGKFLDTPTSGTITIAVDEALQPLMEAEISAFTALYTNAHINAIYVSEGEAIDSLLVDSVRLAVVTRKLVKDEEDYLETLRLPAAQVRVAINGIALIVHPDNRDTLMTTDQLKQILTGQIKQWNELNNSSNKAPLNVVFDQPNSGIIRFLNDSLTSLKNLPENVFAVKSNAAVVDYVSSHPEALGLIDVSWISDRDDATTNTFLGSVKVVGLSTGGEYYKPFQAYLSQRQYPLLRDVYLISREGRTGLATGFTAFVASDKGQRVILKSGLVPATMPVRIVEINRTPFK